MIILPFLLSSRSGFGDDEAVGDAACRVLRYLWASSGTLLGLFLVGPALLTGGRASARNGILEAHGGIVSWLLRYCTPVAGGVLALTLGHVVFGRTEADLTESRSHEMVHVRQYERWGPFFLPAYLMASLYMLLTGHDFYRDNPFEREAFLLQ